MREVSEDSSRTREKENLTFGSQKQTVNLLVLSSSRRDHAVFERGVEISQSLSNRMREIRGTYINGTSETSES